MRPLRVITLAADADREAALARSLAARPDVELVMRCVDRIEAAAAIRGGDLDAILSVGEPPWFDLELADEAARYSARVIGIGAEPSSVVGRQATSLLPSSADVGEIVRRARDGRPAPPPPPPSAQPDSPKGRVVAVWGPKGAPGRSMLSLELSRCLSALDANTLLVDADPYGGDILQMADIVDDLPTVIWAAQLAARERLDAGRLMTSLRRIGDGGPVLLPGLPRGDLWEEVSAFGWRRLLTVARSLFNTTVCDVGFSLEADEQPHAMGRGERNLMTRATLQEADRVVAICRADVVGIKNFIWAYDALSNLVDADKVVIIANRVPDGDESAVGDLLRRHLAKRPIAYLPSVRVGGGGGGRVPRSMRRAGIDAGLRTLIASLGGPVAPRGLLRSLSGAR